MTWTQATLPPNADPWATPYGVVMDHVWAKPETHIARRESWPRDTWIVVLPCIDDAPTTEWSEGATHWVFFAGAYNAGSEYVDVPSDLYATDWLLGEREDVG